MKRKTMLGQNRALGSTSLGQPSQPNRLFSAPSQEERDGRSFLTVEDVRKVFREELEHLKSHSAEYGQSCTGNAHEDIVRQIRSLEIVVRELKEAVEVANIHSTHLKSAYGDSKAYDDKRNLQLRFCTKLSCPIFTGNKLEGEGGARISVTLVDIKTGDVITSGPESSIKLNVLVLEGDFTKEEGDHWAQEEFENYVVKQREGKGLILTGDLQLTLKGGKGELGQLMFTDNSSWNRSKTFRIGLQVAPDYRGDTRIQEAITDAFPVREHRGEAYKKSYPPKSDDEVWRLEKIAKDGKSHQKLREARIHKVEDLLLQYFTDRDKLRQILGKSIIQKNWECLISHASTCKINRLLYLYYPHSTRKDGALFDTGGQLIGLIKDRVYVSTHQLSAQEKDHGDTIVKKALDNLNDVMELNGETFSPIMLNESSRSSTPQVCDALKASVPNEGLTPEGQSQYHTFGNAKEFPVDESVLLAAHQPISADQNANFGNAMDISFDNSIPFASHQPIYDGQNVNYGNAKEFPVDESVLLAAHQPISANQNANFGNAMDISFDNSIPLASHQPISARQNADHGNAKEFPVDESVLQAAHQPISADQNADFGNISFEDGVHLASQEPTSADENANFGNTTIPEDNLTVPFSPGENGITSAGVPTESHQTNLQYAMHNQMIDPWSPLCYIVNEDVLPSGRTSTSTFQDSSTYLFPEGNDGPDYFQSTMAEDIMEIWR